MAAGSIAAPAAGSTTATPRLDLLLPTLHIIGNPKSGSTALFHCLRAGGFDADRVCGRNSSTWRSCRAAALFTALGAKKEFNFYGGASWPWGERWYEGLRGLSVRLWERAPTPQCPQFVPGVCQRRGDNVGNRAVLHEVTSACRVLPAVAERGVCGHFPLECDKSGKPVVAPGCGRSRTVADEIFLSHAWPSAAEVPPGSRSVDPSISHPYWDFMIDAGRNWQNSTVFSDDFFGPVRTSAADDWVVTSGPFAYLP